MRKSLIRKARKGAGLVVAVGVLVTWCPLLTLVYLRAMRHDRENPRTTPSNFAT